MQKNQNHPRNVRLLLSAAHFSDLPPSAGEEYAVLGRSNVGKSSFINHIFDNKSLARVSKTPGKTRLANYYKIDEQPNFVDLPGYGYARVSGDEKVRWSQLISDYCMKRSNLKGVIWLVDIRHIGVKADLEANEWLKSIKVPVLPVLTKSDKLSKSSQAQSCREFSRIFAIAQKPMIFTINNPELKDRFWEYFLNWRGALDK